jgi:hypothetical protein
MTEQEQNLIKQIVANRPQFEAVKTFLLSPLEPHSWLPQLDLDKNDAEYGQTVKVAVKAKNTLLDGFEDMERLLEKEKPKEQINEAR